MRFKRWRPTIALLAAALVVLLAAVGCGDDGTSSGETSGETTAAAEPQKVRVLLGFRESLVWIGYLMAQDRFFRDENLDVETVVVEGAPALQTIISGKEKFGVIAAPQIMIANAQGGRLRAVAAVNHDLFRLVVPEDSGITSVADLRGKKIGITGDGGEEPLLRSVLAAEGLTPGEDVELPVVGTGAAVANALQSGAIDAYTGFVNDVAAIDGVKGLRLVNILPDDFQGLPFNEITLAPGAIDNPADVETAVKISRAWLKGTQFAVDNPDEAFAIGCRMVPEDCQDRALARKFFDVTVETARAEDPSRAGWHDYVKLETTREIAEKGGDLRRDAGVDVEEIFSNDYIEEINR